MFIKICFECLENDKRETQEIEHVNLVCQLEINSRRILCETLYCMEVADILIY